LVSVGLAVMLLAGGWGPHGNSGIGVRTPLESRRHQPLNSFRNGLLPRESGRMEFSGITSPISRLETFH
jgi:hypothetical protein